MQHVKRPFTPLALITSASPSALVSEYESLCLEGYGNDSSPFCISCIPSKTTLGELVWISLFTLSLVQASIMFLVPVNPKTKVNTLLELSLIHI